MTNDNSDTGASDSRSIILWKSSRRQSRGEAAEGAEEESAEERIQAIDNDEEDSELDDQ